MLTANQAENGETLLTVPLEDEETDQEFASPPTIVPPVKQAAIGCSSTSMAPLGFRTRPMKLSHVSIQNFRGIKDLQLELDDTTVLIGENNTGKTAVLEALRLCLRELGPRRRVVFDSFDYHLQDEHSEPINAEPICITLRFAESAVGEWEDARIRRLRSILHVNGDGLNAVVLKVTCAYNAEERVQNPI